ncbi:hypothetical protein KJ591_01405 [Patescibacteria group bacterium]|nr:hypothetical protein [Patescibacteria group bacterium]MBU4023002.1 hypothetical protein [Patescibacteria group bacterium]MBU4162198.1 hypothetical protein [Patescibacteria group bacterium]
MQGKKRYHQNYQAKKRSYTRKKKSIFRNRFFWYFVLLVIAGAGIFYFLVFSPVFQLRETIINGTSFISANEVGDIIREQTANSVLFFPTKSIIVFNSKNTESLILERFLQAKEAIIRKQFFNKLIVNIFEREPEAIFCSSGSCFLLDEQGLIFQPAERETYFPNKAVIVSDENMELGTTVTSEENLIFINDVFRQLKQGNILVNEFKISSSKIEALISENGLSIYFNPQKDSELQVQDLILVLKNQNSPDSETRGAQEYIDLRFDKIFLK